MHHLCAGNAGNLIHANVLGTIIIKVQKLMTLEELRAFVATVELTLGDDGIISTGLLQDADDQTSKYEIREGWNPALANACDQGWDGFNVDLMAYIQKHVNASEQTAVLDQIQIDDDHWDWFAKACAYKSNEYRWFFLTVDDKPEGACLIYHPKSSVLGQGDIFYIEYLAVAPWNRENPMQPRKFRSVGSLLVRSAIKYAHDVLNLRYGFSLHSLPRARDYYKKIGMSGHPALDKGVLVYFEMEEVSAAKLVEQA